MRRCALAALLTCTFSGACLSQPNKILQILPPDAGFILGIQLNQPIGLLTGNLLDKHLRESGLPEIPGMTDWGKILRDDVDALYLSVRDLSSVGPQAPILLVVKGRFDRNLIQSLLQGRTETYGNVSLIAPAKMKPPTTRVALLDDNTILAGDRREILAALDRLRAPSPKQARGRLWSRAAELAMRHEVWLVMDAPPSRFKFTNADTRALSQLKGLDLGMTYSRGFEFQMNMQAKSQEAAKSLAASIQGMLAMAALSPQMTADSAELFRKIQITQGPSDIKVSLALTEEEMKKAVAQLQDFGGQKRSLAITGAGQPPAGEPPRRKTIRIFGQENGTVEVPLRDGR